MPAIAIVNQSAILTDEQVVPVIAALQKQLSRDVLPIWGKSAWLTHVKKGALIPPKCWQLILKDTSDDPGALGYHTETSEGLPIGYCFVKTTTDDGGNWTVTLSHELLEMVGDEYTNLLAQGIVNGKSYLRALELCDPCEDDSFGYKIDDIVVSDFVTPQYFIDEAKSGPYDFGNHITAPGQLLLNGYQSVLDGNNWTDITAEKAPKYKAPWVGSRRWLRQTRQEIRNAT